MASVKAETGSYNPTGTTSTGPFALPSRHSVGHPLINVIASATSTTALSPVPTGWTQLGTGVDGTSAWIVLKRNGGWQSSDGTSVTLNFTGGGTVTYSAVALDGTLYDPDTFTVGTVTTRSTSITATTAVSAGTGASDTLVISAEKASSHTGAPTAPSVSPATTLGSWRASTTASTPSTYVGIYSGATATRTITYTTASSNGAAFQVALTAAAAPTPTAVPQSGAVTAAGFATRFATTNTTSARIATSTSPTMTSPTYTGTITPDSDGIVTATITGLTADTVYYYALEANGTLLTGAGQIGTVRTFPTAGSAASGTFLFGSCQVTDSNHATFATMTAHTTPHTRYGFIHLGDLHYRDWQTNGITAAATIKAQQKSSTQQSNVAGLLAATPWVYLWDNHDWGGALSDATNPAAATLEAMYRQMVPSYPLPTDTSDNTGAIDHTFTFGRVSFFVMDTRSQRDPSGNPNTSTKTMLGAGQKARLKTWMADPAYPMKVMLQGTTWRDDGNTAGDRWGAYPNEFAELSNYWAASGHGALYSLSGDIHWNAADDGTNETHNHVPDACASAFDQAFTNNVTDATHWSQGGSPVSSSTVTTHNFAQLDIADTGSTITVTYTGYDSTDTSNITMTTIVATAVTMAGSGTMGAAGLAQHPATVTMSGAGTMAASGTDVTSGTIAMAGAGAVGVAPSVQHSAVLAVSGGGTLTAAGSQTGTAALAMTGATALSLTGTVQHSATLALLGTGTMAATGRDNILATVAMAGAGAMGVATSGQQTAAVALGGTGVLGLAGAAQHAASATMTGAGALVTAGFGTSSAAAAMVGSGILAVTPAVTHPATMAMAGASTLAASGVDTVLTAAAMSGAGVMLASPGGQVSAAAAMVGSGSVAVSPALTHPAAVAMTGTSLLGAAGLVSVTVSTAISGAGSMSMTGAVRVIGALAMVGAGALGAMAAAQSSAQLAMLGAATMSATGTSTTGRDITLTAELAVQVRPFRAGIPAGRKFAATVQEQP